MMRGGNAKALLTSVCTSSPESGSTSSLILCASATSSASAKAEHEGFAQRRNPLRRHGRRQHEWPTEDRLTINELHHLAILLGPREAHGKRHAHPVELGVA